VGGELQETNPCVSLWFASLSWFRAYLICFHFDLLGCAICVCRDHYPDCRMDLPGPTASVGTRADYSVGPWDYPACAPRYLIAWSTRTT
jgi:hypothetical protein